MTSKTLTLIEKLINLTTNGILNWEVCEKSSLALNPEYSSIFSSTPLVTALSSHSTLLDNRSYITQYKNGYIALLAYSNIAYISVKLILQSSEDAYPKTIASSNNENSDISSGIKRLYNLVDLGSEDTDVTDYIDSILND